MSVCNTPSSSGRGVHEALSHKGLTTALGPFFLSLALSALSFFLLELRLGSKSSLLLACGDPTLALGKMPSSHSKSSRSSSSRHAPGMFPMMMPMGPMPHMMMPQPPQNDSSSSEDEQTKEQRRERERMDKRRLASSYKTLGGPKGGMLKGHKLEFIEDMTNEVITAARCISLDECQLDQVIFVLTAMSPYTKLLDLRVYNKFDIKTKLTKEFKRLGNNRLSDFASDMSNVSELALNHGWDPEWDYVIPKKVPKAKPAAKAEPQQFAQITPEQLQQLHQFQQLQQLQQQLQQQSQPKANPQEQLAVSQRREPEPATTGPSQGQVVRTSHVRYSSPQGVTLWHQTQQLSAPVSVVQGGDAGRNPFVSAIAKASPLPLPPPPMPAALPQQQQQSLQGPIAKQVMIRIIMFTIVIGIVIVRLVARPAANLATRRNNRMSSSFIYLYLFIYTYIKREI